MFTTRLMLLHDPVSVDPGPFTVHWLFCTVPEEPMASGVNALPESLARLIVRLATLSTIQQAFCRLKVLFMITEAYWMSAIPPLGSDQVKVNCWFAPLPELGFTETFRGG